jgi:hypothetical protein
MIPQHELDELRELAESLKSSNRTVDGCLEGVMAVGCLQLLSHIDALQAVVDKLSKTEDGATIIPGVEIFVLYEAGSSRWISPRTVDAINNEGCYRLFGDTAFCFLSAYAIRANAEAALAAKEQS